MGFQTMGTHWVGQQPHLQPLARQNSWFSLTLGEIESQCGEFSKPLGSMNLDELLKNVCSSEATQSSDMDVGSSSLVSSLQCQAGLALARAFNGKTVDEVWREIQQRQKVKNVEEIKVQEREPTLDQITLEDFLVKAGHFAEVSSGPLVGVDDAVATQKVQPQPQISLSPSHSIDALSDTPGPGQKRGSADAFEKTLERRLKRKIKNRESAARSRARKQAYHNELVVKVSCLEEENMKLKKEKELEKVLPWELSPEPRYQLRRTNSI